jgi:hypothetical protein
LVTQTGVVVPNGYGTTEIVVRYEGHETRATVEVIRFADPDPIHFQTEVIAALSRAGCNSGACHGSPKGKNGFRLSLRGFEPTVDFTTLTLEGFGRRTNPLAADDSLVLQKGLARIGHKGGKRFTSTDRTYQILRTWIAQGCRAEGLAEGLAAEAPTRQLDRLEVLPASRRLAASRPRQQLVARAHYSDGTSRDVTDLAVFSSSAQASATVSKDGFVEFRTTASTTILVRYLDQIRSAELTYVDRDSSF